MKYKDLVIWIYEEFDKWDSRVRGKDEKSSFDIYREHYKNVALLALKKLNEYYENEERERYQDE